MDARLLVLHDWQWQLRDWFLSEWSAPWVSEETPEVLNAGTPCPKSLGILRDSRVEELIVAPGYSLGNWGSKAD